MHHFVINDCSFAIPPSELDFPMDRETWPFSVFSTTRCFVFVCLAVFPLPVVLLVYYITCFVLLGILLCPSVCILCYLRLYLSGVDYLLTATSTSELNLCSYANFWVGTEFCNSTKMPRKEKEFIFSNA